MINNAIPGINNINAYVNTTTARGIDASQNQTADFQKALLNANTQKRSTEISNDVAKTLSATGAVTKNVSATYEKSKAAKELDAQNNQTAATEKAATTVTKETTETNTGKENVTNEEAVASVNATEEAEENTQVIAETEENTEGESAVVVIAEEADDALQEAMLESSRQLLEELADALGVDIEDIQDAMATLGLTTVAILDPMNLTQIVGQLTGANDVMAIVTNADLYLNVQNMQDAVDTTRQDLMQEFGLTEEGLSSALENFNEALSEKMPKEEFTIESADEKAPVNIPGVAGNDKATEGVRLDITGDGLVKEVSQTATEVQKTTDNNNFEVIPEETDELTPDFKITVETEEQHEEHHSENKKQENTEGSIYNQVMNRISSSLFEVVETESYGQMARANTQEIMDQITEYIKMNVKPDTTTMELQLHPASLGNVNVIIEAAKEGSVIAKFLTQNEDVKAAIESQIQQLQEKLNEQGVKVTAVEVTVNAGAFDQALNDSQSQREDDADAQESIRKPMRRIRLDDLALEELGEIEEEDKLTAEMMAINGNSVDFSA
ncbi:flagellar hook-length control protein FliK [Butyrivibrio sp. VCD2006]|uniref:flagellar hook-length control protein FliK n=1 Tax=Butyrivibrio sp. VCD2006 TaxID=1280664 RepID=UPI0003FA5887|nr:flagellar hook-length control protein FliK [Butyrivibrio sp. VCD2006]